MVRQVVSGLGRIDILVNCAGSAAFRPLQKTTESQWDAMLDTNLKGTFLCCQQVIPQMLKQGAGDIVNIASVAGLEPFNESAAYCASKFGLVGLSKALSLEFRKKGIRVITVCPGAVDTELWDSVQDAPARERMLRPEEVAAAVVDALTFSRRAVVDLIRLTPPEGIL
jgi:NAD(P)-dependent dehydrogenase (short-subunit alcohol dehydrogenase family)